MKKFDRLKREAREAATWRGHDMRRFQKPDLNMGTDRAWSDCRRCGKSVHVDASPMPNGIDIGGEAVALGCED